MTDRNRAALEALDRIELFLSQVDKDDGGPEALSDAPIIRAALTQQAEPAGWKFVPVEPTAEMVTRGWNGALQVYAGAAGSRACWAAMLAAAPQAEPPLWRTGMTEAETDAALAAHPTEQPAATDGKIAQAAAELAAHQSALIDELKREAAATDSEREECARWLDEQVKRLERDDIFGERRTRLVQAARLLGGKP